MKRDIIRCPICGEIAAVDDGLPNFQPVLGDSGKLRLEEVPLPVLCEKHELRYRLMQFERDVIQLTRP